MAAETSIDAQVPVVLALVKLALFYGVDVFSKEVSQRCTSVTVLSVIFSAWSLQECLSAFSWESGQP